VSPGVPDGVVGDALRLCVSKPARETELLEALQAALEARSTAQPTSLGEPGVTPSPRPLRVLVAEDHPVNQQLAIHLLERRGQRAHVVPDGRAAVEALRRDPYDIVLMDVQMPVLDWLAATRQIRAWEEVHGGHIPVVAMTAAAMKGDRERCLDAGMDAYLSKPLQQKLLFGVIEELAGGGSEVSEQAPVEVTVEEQESVVDEATLRNRVSDDPELLAKLVEIYERTTPELLSGLQSSLEAGNVKGAFHAVHKLAGSLTNLAADESSRIALHMQDFLRADDLLAARELLPGLVSALERLGPRLQSLVTPG